MSATALIVATMAVPLAGALLIGALGRLPALRDAVVVLASLALLMVVAGLLPTVLAGGRPSLSALEMLPGLSIAFRVEPLGMLFALVASSLWTLNSLYAIG
ncbi:MAG: hypothetical protein ABIO71_09995, partial [Caldimonas sp.]